MRDPVSLDVNGVPGDSTEGGPLHNVTETCTSMNNMYRNMLAHISIKKCEEHASSGAHPTVALFRSYF